MNARKLGKYEVLERLGRGGMAEVYRAYHANLDRYVAIKVLHNFLADDDEFAGRFGREAQNIARLKHPHIVQVYDYEFDEASGSYYMVMELINGNTLKDQLYETEKAGSRFPLDESLRITREAASALAYAHKSGMIHRDVKPANLMLDSNENDRFVLTDFGIAKIVTGSQFTVTGGLVGTPAYMSPEQGVGETGSERSDLYSLGIILYQMLTGKLPYDAETPLALILKHMNDPIPTVREVVPELPEATDTVLSKLLAKEPEERYATAEHLITDIRQIENSIQRNDDTPVNLDDVTYGLAQAKPKQDDDDNHPTLAIDSARHKDQQPLTERPTTPYSEDEQQPTRRLRPVLWGVGLIGIIVLLLGGYAFGAANGMLPAVGFLASPTPTSEAEPEPTAIVSIAEQTEEPTRTQVTPTDTPVMPTSTVTPTATQTPTHTPSETATLTPSTTPTPTPVTPTQETTPTPTVNATATFSAQQTATFAACDFDYGIIEQDPEDGAKGDFYPTGSDYTREITLLNTGNCPWERNTSLTFLRGESFNAGPRIFIRDPVPIGQEVEITFEGTLPQTGSTEPISGTWQLRTPGQIPIGEPFEISIQVYDPGQ